MTIHVTSTFRPVSSEAQLGVNRNVTRRGAYRNFFKRVLDVTLVLLGAPVVLPVVLILAILIARDGHSPIYWSARVGRGGRVFRMMKLRTMVPHADAKLEAHLAANPEDKAEWASTQKLKQDPRITRFGRALRKASLDELPQLWNVIKGDMSLVGPRPMMPYQQAMYPGDSYYSLRPGVTGPWQVSERNLSTFAKRADFDRDYENSLSLKADLMILARTFTIVVKGTGF